MAKNKVKFGTVYSEKSETGPRVYIGLGSKNRTKPEYNTTVEIIVKDSTGKVIHKQTDGFVNVEDPRKRAEELLSLGKITEEQAEKMRENASRIPDKVKHELYLSGE